MSNRTKFSDHSKYRRSLLPQRHGAYDREKLAHDIVDAIKQNQEEGKEQFTRPQEFTADGHVIRRVRELLCAKPIQSVENQNRRRAQQAWLDGPFPPPMLFPKGGSHDLSA